MTVSAGQMLGPYEIVSRIGAGGMGEVFKARDVRLGRAVAVKVLPEQYRGDAMLRVRFEREARAVSKLSHPNICTLFDVGPDYLVMELLEGETLATRLRRGPLPIEDAIRHGIEIASALDRAHREGIVHRDLKPANIMLTKSGAKLLDFGLARTTAIDPHDETQAKPVTRAGAILGTFHYMSPEQLEGSEADARSDIFSLGCVLYEMVTGHRAFDGTTPLTPPALDHVVQRCLARDPERRWQSAADVAAELQWSTATPREETVPQRVSRAWLGWSVAAMIAMAAIAWISLHRPEAPRRIQSAIVLPDGVSLVYGGGTLALSPDGRTLAFVGRTKEGSKIWLRAIDSGAMRALANTGGARMLLWSPDGKSIVFFGDSEIQRVDVDNGTVAAMSFAFRMTGGDWTKSGELIAATSERIVRIPAPGAAAVPILHNTLDRLRWPRLLPGGRTLLFLSTGETPGLYAMSVEGGAPRRISTEVMSNFEYLEPGWLVYAQDGNLLARRFDARSLALQGNAIRLASNVQFDPSSVGAMFSMTRDGTLVYAAGSGALLSQLVIAGRDGRELETLVPPGVYYVPRFSHDGRRVALDVSRDRNNGDIWLFDLQRRSFTRLTSNPANESSPAWSHDDRSVYHFLELPLRSDIVAESAGGTGAPVTVLQSKAFVTPLDASMDGKWLAVLTGAERTEVALLDLEKRKLSPFLKTAFHESAAQFSPDGKWIAWVSTESGNPEVYVRAFPKADEKFMVSRGGGTQPAWRGDGRELFYVAPDMKMMSVALQFEPAFKAGTPVALFESNLRPSTWFRDYDVSADGQRFVLDRVLSTGGPQPLTLVQNALPR